MRRLTVRPVLTSLLLCWSFAFLWVLQKDRYAYFIRPDFRWLIYSSLFFCALLSLALIVPGGQVRRLGTLEIVVRTSIMLLPLIYMRAMTGETLSSRDLALRAVASPTLSKGFRPAQKTRDLPLAARTGIPISSLIGVIRPKWMSEIEKLSSTRSSKKKLPIIKIKSEFLKVYGNPVETIGMVYRDDRLPANCFIAFQFHIVCCAADAMPIGCLVQWANNSSLKNDSWCKISGTVTKGEFNGKPVIMVKANNVKKIKTPSNPYSY